MPLHRYPFHLLLAQERAELSARDVNLPSLRSYVYELGRRWGAAFRVSGARGDKVFHVTRLTLAEARDEGRYANVPDDVPAGSLYHRGVKGNARTEWEYENREASIASYAVKVVSAAEVNHARLREHDPRFRRHFEGWVLRDSVRVLPAIPDEEDE